MGDNSARSPISLSEIQPIFGKFNAGRWAIEWIEIDIVTVTESIELLITKLNIEQWNICSAHVKKNAIHGRFHFFYDSFFIFIF